MAAFTSRLNRYGPSVWCSRGDGYSTGASLAFFFFTFSLTQMLVVFFSLLQVFVGIGPSRFTERRPAPPVPAALEKNKLEIEPRPSGTCSALFVYAVRADIGAKPEERNRPGVQESGMGSHDKA